MEIKIVLEEKDAEKFLVARSKDFNVIKYSEEAKADAVRIALYDTIYETVANFDYMAEMEVKKAQIKSWLENKQREYNKGKEDDSSLHD